MVNGLTIRTWIGCYYCHHCDHSCDNQFYHCFTCHKDMCMLCFEEMRAKHWRDRKNSLQICRSHDIHYIDIICVEQYCDECSKEVPLNDFTHMYKDPRTTDNLCVECYNQLSDTEKEYFDIYPANKIYDNNRFGSLMDWLPFCKTPEYDYLLVNRNKDSADYLRFACAAVDDHGRYGYYVLRANYDDILMSINTLMAKNNQTGLYSTSIKLYMKHVGLKIHFG